MAANFKTCMFGGFDRKDVVDYIEKTSKENGQKIEELTKRCDTLTEENASLHEQVAALQDRLSALEGVETERRKLEQQLSELEQDSASLKRTCADLQQENGTLQQQADEYIALRDHIAEIEITAHRRTEEFRAQTVRRIRELIVHQQQWCSENRQRYQELLQAFCGKLESAWKLLDGTDLSGFQEVCDQLQALSDELDQEKQ